MTIPFTKKLILISTLSLGLGACAYNQSPVVDLAGVSPADYQIDLAYCEDFAANVDKAEASRVAAANGAASAAGTGAIVGAFDDGIEGAVAGALVGALFGAVTGSIDGAVEATYTQEQVLRNCLVDKGYQIYDRQY